MRAALAGVFGSVFATLAAGVTASTTSNPLITANGLRSPSLAHSYATSVSLSTALSFTAPPRACRRSRWKISPNGILTIIQRRAAHHADSPSSVTHHTITRPPFSVLDVASEVPTARHRRRFVRRGALYTSVGCFKRLFTVSIARVAFAHLYASSALFKSKTCAKRRTKISRVTLRARASSTAPHRAFERASRARARILVIAASARASARAIAAPRAPARARSSPRTDCREFCTAPGVSAALRRSSSSPCAVARARAERDGAAFRTQSTRGVRTHHSFEGL